MDPLICRLGAISTGGAAGIIMSSHWSVGLTSHYLATAFTNRQMGNKLPLNGTQSTDEGIGLNFI
jgi:hypothetical protein